jgi:glucose-1-phosphate cytidylyltransferase
MKAVILCGGLGTRISEETNLKPKPMIEIGGKPILWHVMKMYASHGVTEFILCTGYKGYVIKEYFANYFLHMSDVTFDVSNNSMEVHLDKAEPWKVTIIDTGENSMTGGRLKRVSKYLDAEESFFFTYGDGVGDVDISATLKYHLSHGSLATMTAVHPPGRFGALSIDKDQTITSFYEKPRGDGDRVNGGFFVLSPKVIDFINDDSTTWEQEPLMNLANGGQLKAYFHDGFWQPMDTLRDKVLLEKLWSNGKAPWRVWQ